MNKKERAAMKRLGEITGSTAMLSNVKNYALGIILEEFQDENRTMTPGYVDTIFNNYGSGSSDR